MEYYSCSLLEQCSFNVLSMNSPKGEISLCCAENLNQLPSIWFEETPEKTLQSFLGMQASIIAESQHMEEQGQDGCRHFSKVCEGCTRFQKHNWVHDGRIHYVNLSMYPSPCQCKCFYCDVHRTDQTIDADAEKYYEKIFSTLELAKKQGIIAPDAVWQISPGEIAIHPYRDRIMELVKNQRACFYTNCFKYDQKIAQNLHENPYSAINLSIDSGTPITWKKVKGVDNFEHVLENLFKYHAASQVAGQISLKYIIFPDINDIYEDFCAVIEIAKALDVEHLTISRDTRVKYNFSDEYHTKLLGAAGWLLALAHKNGLDMDMFTYTPEEEQTAILFARELLQSGQL